MLEKPILWRAKNTSESESQSRLKEPSLWRGKNPRRRRDPRRPVKGRSRRERSRTPASGGRNFQRRGDSREATPSAARTWSMARSCGGVSSVASESIKRQRGHEAHNYMPAHDVVRRLDQGTQAELRLVVAREKAQTRFKQFRWQWSPGAASGADDCDDEYRRVQQSLVANAWVHVSLPRRAPLMPGLSGFVHGIQHHNTSEDTRGLLLHPIRAWHSTKQYFYHMFKEDIGCFPVIQGLHRIRRTGPGPAK